MNLRLLFVVLFYKNNPFNFTVVSLFCLERILFLVSWLVERYVGVICLQTFEDLQAKQLLSDQLKTDDDKLFYFEQHCVFQAWAYYCEHILLLTMSYTVFINYGYFAGLIAYRLSLVYSQRSCNFEAISSFIKRRQL